MRQRLHTILMDAFQRMRVFFGPPKWWPAETPFEVMIGAILTQNTSWKNVEKAIVNLKREDLLDPQRLFELPPSHLATLIRPVGYYRLKTTRLRHFLSYMLERYGGDVNRMAVQSPETLRAELLEVKGIGPETADAMLLYALGKPIFVVDAYTKRILQRHFLCAEDDGYAKLQELFMDALPHDVQLLNEYHALLVEVGKNYCRAHPKCETCPLNGWNWKV